MRVFLFSRELIFYINIPILNIESFPTTLFDLIKNEMKAEDFSPAQLLFKWYLLQSPSVAF